MTTSSLIQTIGDLLDRLGGIPPERVRFRPAPGTATEEDVVEVERRENRLCELVDGVLVEKAMGFRESLLAAALLGSLRSFVIPRNLGIVSGPDGMIGLFPGLVRIPDVAFVSWERVPGGRVPEDPVPVLVPDLAVEVRSRGNTDEELDRKRGEYFKAGVRQVWLIDPDLRTVTVHDGPGRSRTWRGDVVLDGGEILPGFTLDLRELFSELDRRGGV